MMVFGKIIAAVVILTIGAVCAVGQEPGSFTSSPISKERAPTAEEHYLGYEALSEAARSIVNVVKSRAGANGNASLIVCGKSDCRRLVEMRLLYELFEAGSGRIISEYQDPVFQSALTGIVDKLSSGEPTGDRTDIRQPAPAALASAPGKISEALEAWTGVIGQANTAVTEAAKLINSLTKTDVTVTSSVIDATNSQLTTAIAGQLATDAGARVYLPEYEQMENVNVQESKAYVNYGKMRVILDRGGSRLSRIKYLLRVSPTASSLSAFELDQIDKLQGLVRDTDEILTITVAHSPDGEENGETSERTSFVLDLKALETLIKAERFSTELRNGAMILSVDIVKVLGTRIEKRNLILGVRNRFSGSATVQYVLTDNKGNLLLADTALIHTGSRKPSEVRGGRVP